jgi:hypothetical protein
MGTAIFPEKSRTTRTCRYIQKTEDFIDLSRHLQEYADFVLQKKKSVLNSKSQDLDCK